MEPIKKEESKNQSDIAESKFEERVREYGKSIEQSTVKRKRLVRSAINYIGTVIAMFIIFVAIVVSTTDITLMVTSA